MPSGHQLDSGTNLSNFPTVNFPLWNKNWLDGSADWFYALWDIEVYNMFVNAVNERLAVFACLNNVGNPSYDILLPHAVEGDYILGQPYGYRVTFFPPAEAGLSGATGGGSGGTCQLVFYVTIKNTVGQDGLYKLTWNGGTGDWRIAVPGGNLIIQNGFGPDVWFVNSPGNVWKVFSSAVCPEVGIYDFDSGPDPGSTAFVTASPIAHDRVGWGAIVAALNLMDPEYINQSVFVNGNVVRVQEPPYTPFNAFSGSTFNRFPALSASGTGATYLVGHLPDYYIPHKYPREIATRSATAASAGAHARLIRAKSLDSDSGSIFTSTGSVWNIDTAVALPDVLTYNDEPIDPAQGGTSGARAELPVGGDYFTATFLQRLRDKINMTVGFYVVDQSTIIGAGYPDAFYITLDFDNVQDSGDLLLVNWGQGDGTAMTLAAADTAAQGSFASGTNAGSAPSPLGSYFGSPLGIVASWACNGPIGGVGTGPPWTVTAYRVGFRARVNSYPTANGSFSCQISFGLKVGLGNPGGGFWPFAALASPVVNSHNSTGSIDYDQSKFFHTSPVLSGATNQIYRSAVISSPSTYPDGIAAGGDTLATAYIGWSDNSINEAGPGYSSIFGVVRYDVAGGFLYTKDYAGPP